MSVHAVGRLRSGPRPPLWRIAGGELRERARATAGATLAAIVVAVAAGALTSYFTRRGVLLGVAGVVVVAGSAWFATTRHTALALALLMVYLGAFDGYLKLATGSTLVTFVRDALLFALVAGQLIRASALRTPLPLPPLGGLVIGFVALVLIQLANPQNGSLVHSLAGVRQNLEFVPLFFLAYGFVRTKRALRTLVIMLALLAAANGVVGVVQSRLAPAQLATWGPGYAQRVLGQQQFALGGRTFYDTRGSQHTRPFGLMSDAGTGGLLGALSLGAVIALISIGRRRYLVIGVASGALALAGIVTSQGRAAVIASIVAVLSYLAVTATSRQRLSALLAVSVVAGLAYFAGAQLLGGTANRYTGLDTTHIFKTTQAARGKAFAAVPGNLVNYPLGSGLGTGGPAAGQAGAPAAFGTANAENELSFAVLETGIPGMVLLLALTATIFATGVRCARLEPDHETRVLLAAIIAPVGALLAVYLVSAVSPTVPGGPLLWSAGGIVSWWLIARRPGLTESA